MFVGRGTDPCPHEFIGYTSPAETTPLKLKVFEAGHTKKVGQDSGANGKGKCGATPRYTVPSWQTM